MTRSPHQDAIDALVRKLSSGDEEKNANGRSTAGQAAFRTDAEILAKCRAAANAAKFATLYNHGDALAYHGGDDSAADLALLRMMAYYTQDPAQLERLFRGSSLMREKFDRNTYRTPTITKALSGLGETYRWPGENGDDPSVTVTVTPNSSGNGNARQRLTSTAFAEMPPPEPRRYLVDGIVPEAYPTMIYGDGGVAKSMLALSLGLGVSSNAGTWLGLAIEPGAVLYLDFELDANEQMRRVSRLARAEGLDTLPGSLRYMSAVGVRARDAFEDALIECKEHDVRLLIVDSLGPALEGDAEASRDVISFYNEIVGPFRTAGVAPLVIDHQSKMQAGERYQQKRAFGSVFKSNLARSVLQVEATSRSDGELTVRLRQNKHNFGPLLQPFGARLSFSEEEVRVEAVELEDAELAEEGTLNARQRVLLALNELGEATPSEIHELLSDLTLGTVKKEITNLKKVAKVEETDEVRDRQRVVKAAVTVTEPYRGNGNGNASETDRLQAARKAVADSNKLTHLRAQVVAGRADPDALAGALAAQLRGDWKEWRDAARALADEYGEEELHG